MGFFKKKAGDDFRRSEILAELGVSEGAPAYIPEAISRSPGEHVRVGIIGFGGEGESLVRNAGFATPSGSPIGKRRWRTTRATIGSRATSIRMT